MKIQRITKTVTANNERLVISEEFKKEVKTLNGIMFKCPNETNNSEISVTINNTELLNDVQVQLLKCDEKTVKPNDRFFTLFKPQEIGTSKFEAKFFEIDNTKSYPYNIDIYLLLD